MSTLQNPTHVYDDAGDYTVKLTIIGPLGNDVEEKSEYITIEEEST